MQQQQRPRDRVAAMQQMAGSSEFQPPQQAGHGGKPQQMGEASDRSVRVDRDRKQAEGPLNRSRAASTER